MKENLREIHRTKIRQPEPKPKPIHLISTTFSTAKPIVTYGTSTAHSSRCTPHHDARSVELPSGQILFDATPSVSLDRDGLLLSPAADELTSKGRVTSWLVASASGAWDLPTAEGADSDEIDEDEDEKSEIHSLPFDVKSWYEKVAYCEPEPILPLIPTPFKRGIIGSYSVNDILMIKGLIHPLVYVDFLDLSAFSVT
jgi:hypothetical protein